jgi:hypothetical protein
LAADFETRELAEGLKFGKLRENLENFGENVENSKFIDH